MATKKATTKTKKAVKKPARKAPRKAAAKQKAPAPSFDRRKNRLETLRLRSAAPAFTVNDIEKTLAWYRDVLGFATGERWEHDGKLMGVELVAGTVTFMISQDDWKKGRDRVKGEGLRIHCSTAQDVNQLAQQIRARGGTLIQEPRDEPWGVRDFAVADPDGFKITIASEPKA